MKADKSQMPGDIQVKKSQNVQWAMPGMHYHDFYEIYIQDQGTREHNVNNCLYQLKPHDILLLKPYQLHQSLGGQLHTRTVIYFRESYLRRYFSPEIAEGFMELFSCPCLSLPSESYLRMTEQIKQLEKDLLKGEEETFGDFAGIMLLLLEQKKQSEKKGPVEKEGVAEKDFALIQYLHENYLTLSGLSDIASSFYVTPSHLCRSFKKRTGYTVIQYLNMLKIQKACELLRDTRLPVTQIAAECGFHSAMYFNKVFREIMNITPTQYRGEFKTSK